ncbi:MAG TPA: hypothetical protein VF142_15645 [Longimicrobium sp.]
MEMRGTETVEETLVGVPAATGGEIGGTLAVPPGAGGVVVLFQVPGGGAGGGMDDVARALHAAGLATLRADAVPDGAEAAAGPGQGFDIEAMTARLVTLVDWLWGEGPTRGLPVGCLGTGTAGAAALRAAAARRRVGAVAVLEGRPALAGAALQRVRSPVLLVVGGLDSPLLRLNHRVMGRLRAPALLEVVPGALHVLAGPRSREMVVARVADWFGTHLGTREPARGGTGMGIASHALTFVSEGASTGA